MTGMSIQEIVGVLAQNKAVRRSGGGYMVVCPAHDDGTPSLSISEGTDQPVVLYCHAGCEPDDILAAVGLDWDALSKPMERPQATARKPKGEWTPNGPATAVYTYCDETGEVLSQVLRTADKGFSQRVPDASKTSGWRWNLTGVRRVLYRLPEVIEAVANGQEIWITEGEKDADNMVERAEVCATTSIGGAGKWRHEYGEPLAGADVTIVADTDDQGRKHARQVRASLLDWECRVRIVESAHLKDATDHLDAGGTLDTFLVTVPYEEEEKVEKAYDLDAYVSQELPPQRYVIENTLARGEVLLVTGPEGFGKSTLMKQLAVQVACGIHPWTGDTMDPATVLFIDGENTTPDNHADFARLRWIASQHGDALARRSPLYILEPGPIDLSSDAGLEWFLERVRAHKPDLIVMGPIYNMVSRDLKEEGDARMLKDAVDAARRLSGAAVILEHHSPHGDKDGRDMRPIGSSLLMRWPNFGFGMVPILTPDKRATGVAEFRPWRGGRRRSRHWPHAIRMGEAQTNWMWMEADPIDVERAKSGIAM